MIKSPLRYPGGKQRAIAQIANYLPQSFHEFREPFIGGGSVFLHIRQTYTDIKYWINDLNEELCHFWLQSQNNLPALVERVWQVKKSKTCGRELFNQLAKADTAKMTSLERATRFFVLNRISFSGTIESGGYSEASFLGRFTDSSIDRLAALNQSLVNTIITNLDYRQLLEEPGENVFIFLDPPYLANSQSRLYGKKGDLHTFFDHNRFAKLMQNCPHQWLITYDDCEQVRENFDFAFIYEWELQYGMNNYKQKQAKKGNELFITNYPIDQILVASV
ncbi:MAG: DNA adenine methylase [Woronichinia naegeliana WA131]|jgi:DNA adenine methylase|uniref:site-specific DNA-methyltransferase (adenine-specific) n=1 Tax=Woronichinia naegeliana WA131 TaxID=2824559 RepID=A0A977KUB8_9CYAN|nr:MAG: DNA adenine methylase [Woronichinia naegeliana WA131]